MKKLIGILALVTILCLTMALPGLAVKIAPYSQPLHDIVTWNARSEELIVQNPEGENLTVSWPATVDLINYDGNTWTWDLPDGDSFAFEKDVLINASLDIVKPSGIGVHSVVTPIVAYDGWALGFFGQAIISNPAGNAANAAGGVFEVNVTAEHTGGKTGIWAGIYAGAFANSTTGGQLPTAGIVVETIAGATIDGSTVPLMTFMTSGAGTESKYLFELGNVEAGKTVTTNVDADACMLRTGGNVATNIVLTQGIQIIVNDADYYIPLIAVADWKND